MEIVARQVARLARPLNSPDDHGPMINVISWFLMVLSLLAILARYATKWAVQRAFRWEDAWMISAAAFSVGMTVATSFQVANGLGKPLESMDKGQLQRFQKATYATRVLYISIICTSKVSVIVLIRSLTPQRRFRQLLFFLGLATLVWSITSELVVLFPCHVPDLWKFLNNSCIDFSAFWRAYSAIGLVLEVPLILLPMSLVFTLQMDSKRRRVVIGVFASRILVILAFIAQIVLLSLPHFSRDPTGSPYPIVLTFISTCCVSITTACIPHLRPFMESLESGMIRSDDMVRRHQTEGGTMSRKKDGSSGYRGSGNGSRSRFLAAFARSKEAVGNKPSSSGSRRACNPGRASVGIGLRDLRNPTSLDNRWTEISRGNDVEEYTTESKLIQQTRSWTVSRGTAEGHEIAE